jgi:hypothetical protein
MSKFKKLSKLARLGLAVMAAAVTVWAVDPIAIPITSVEDLQKIGVDPNYPLTDVYTLENDITIESKWTPIGRWSVDPRELPVCAVPCPDAAIGMLYGGAFTGVFYGNGYTIRGLRINIDAAEFFEVDGQPVDAQPAPAIVAAGLFGALDGAHISNLNIEADTVNIKGSYEIGAGILAGFSRNSTITDVRVTGTVNAASVVAYKSTGAIAGGLVGKATRGFITNGSSEVRVRSTSYSLFPSGVPVRNDNIIGGLAGVVEGVVINGSRATTVLNGDGVSAGGLVGVKFGGTITKSSAKTFATNINFSYVGGLAGYIHYYIPVYSPNASYDGKAPPPPPGEINQSYAEVNMNWQPAQTQFGANGNSEADNIKVGGLVGALGSGLISDGYSIGTITGNGFPNILGGLVGCGGQISNTYSAVNIGESAQFTEDIGGLVGASWGSCNMTYIHRSYWDVNVSGVIFSNGIGEEGKTSAEMKRQSTFTDWDFANIWRINEDESYPYFAWQSGTVSISRDAASRLNKNNLSPTATIRGKTLNVKTSSPANLQVRLIDMRGRTLVRFTTEGHGGSFSLNRVSAGRYLVDMRDVSSGRRFTSAVVVR